MSPKECFVILREHIEKLELPAAFKRDVLSTLVYFEVQSELSLEERDHPKELRKVWLELSQRTQGLNLFKKLQDDDLLWRTVKCFVHAEEPASLLIPKVEKPVEVSPYAKWNEVDFFNHLSKEVNARTHLTPFENLSLNIGLWFLESEASKARGNRKPERIKATWKSIQPLLERLGMLREFQKEERLKTQINFFINDKMS
ncbi:hypothetical protein [Bdellovibrio sp. HCB-162]|uniref:hypothetical protein n=1 Tax=Bdellovibrio sp. HCB-162 TaxID=3394234 RepID=UPI0039BC6A66